MIKRRIVKTNGYSADKGLSEMIRTFEKAAEKVFGNVTVDHFLLGSGEDMVKVVLGSNSYGNFMVTDSRVSFNGHWCSCEEHTAFESLTYNDELYDGRLLEIANN